MISCRCIGMFLFTFKLVKIFQMFFPFWKAADTTYHSLENSLAKSISQIKLALGISGIVTTQSSWYAAGSGNSAGAQVDLLVDRKNKTTISMSRPF